MDFFTRQGTFPMELYLRVRIHVSSLARLCVIFGGISGDCGPVVSLPIASERGEA